MKLINREFSGLIINMPPRHGKSELISVYFPAWHLFRWPDKNIIFTTYSNQFASLWGRQVKNIIEEYGISYNIKLSKDARSQTSFTLDGFRGGMHSAGAGSSITGRGADLIIIDDPIKNNTDAKSIVRRNNLWDWFNSTVLTRLEPSGIIVLLMTRWHSDDLCGRILEKNNVITYNDFINKAGKKAKWVHISLPALALHNDILDRLPGSALWPARFDIEHILETKKDMGTYWFEAMYQQNPIQQEDAIFKKKDFRYFTERGDFFLLGGSTQYSESVYKPDCIVRAAIDLAISTKESADYTVIIVFAITPRNQILILDVYRVKINGAEQISLFENIHSRWKQQITGIEAVQFQSAIIDQLLDRGHNIKSLFPKKDKRTRAQGISLRLNNGRVFFRADAVWLADFEKELLEFPSGRHDDQCDAFAYIEYMLDINSTMLPVGRNKRKKISSDFG